jgi:hypothetical protein
LGWARGALSNDGVFKWIGAVLSFRFLLALFYVAQKAAEVAERTRIAAETKAQRKQVQKAIIQTSRPKKRAINGEESERPSKRPRTTVSQSRNATISSNLRIILNARNIQLSYNIITVIESASQAEYRRSASRRPISLPLRFKRSINLFIRFRS